MTSFYIVALTLILATTKISTFQFHSHRPIFYYIRNEEYQNDCRKYWQFRSDTKKFCKMSCPEGSTYLSQTRGCNGPPAKCRPDCFGNTENPLLNWSSWTSWNSRYNGCRIYQNGRREFRYIWYRIRHLQDCSAFCTYYQFDTTYENQPAPVPKPIGQGK